MDSLLTPVNPIADFAAKMECAETTYYSFRRHLGDGREDQASFDAMPSPCLERLYEITLGQDWRVTFARLLQQRLAENADVLYALTGAALSEAVFKSALTPKYPESSELLSREERGQDEILALKRAQDHGMQSLCFRACRESRLTFFAERTAMSEMLARQLSSALNEHMGHHPPRASRPDGFVSKDLEAELTNVFAEALSLKMEMLAMGADVVFRWNHPGEQFSFDTMNVGESHAAPPADEAHMYKVAMCFLPSVEKAAKQGQRPLYKAEVKVADEI